MEKLRLGPADLIFSWSCLKGWADLVNEALIAESTEMAMTISFSLSLRHWSLQEFAVFRPSPSLCSVDRKDKLASFWLRWGLPPPVHFVSRPALSCVSLLSLFSNQSPRAVSCWSKVRLCWAQTTASVPFGENRRGVYAKHDIIVCRHCGSLPKPGRGCQYKCHVDMTFTSWESGRGLAAEHSSATSFRVAGTGPTFDCLRKHSQEVRLHIEFQTLAAAFSRKWWIWLACVWDKPWCRSIVQVTECMNEGALTYCVTLSKSLRLRQPRLHICKVGITIALSSWGYWVS